MLYQHFADAPLLWFKFFTAELETFSLRHSLRSDQEVKALRYGSSLSLRTVCDWYCLQAQNSMSISFLTLKYLNLSTKTRQAPDLFWFQIFQF